MYPCNYVVFSATYSADRSLPGSKLPSSFSEFGGRDPFVAIGSVISSATEKLLVLSSFKEEELNATPTLLYPTSAFRALFSALSAPTVNNSYSVIGPSDEISIIKRLRCELEAKGFKTVSGIRSGRYFIDLAVVGDDGAFSLGILSDHSVLAQQANISAVECSNAEFLSKYGWNLYRLHSAACFDSFEGELQTILRILQAPMQDAALF